MHIQRHTHTSTHVQSARKRNGTMHRSLVERGGRKAFVRDLAHKKKMSKKPIFTNLKNKIRAHRTSSKATRLFLTK